MRHKFNPYCPFLFQRYTRHKSHPNFFFFNDTATTEIYTLSLHDALPIYSIWSSVSGWTFTACRNVTRVDRDRKSTRLNSSHTVISYAVFCLKKKKKKHEHQLDPMNYAVIRQLAYNWLVEDFFPGCGSVNT